MQTEIDQQVISRFYKALDAIIERKDIRGIQTYCNLYGIDKRNLYRQRKDTKTTILHFDWLIPLVTEYGISSFWLLTGIGKMFLPIFEQAKNDPNQCHVAPKATRKNTPKTTV